MKTEDFNTKLNSRFESIRETVIEVLNQLFKQEFTIDQTVIGSGKPHADIQNEAFPKVLLQFKTTVPYTIHHMWTLPNDLVLKLYGWMIDMDADEAVQDEHLEGLKEGVEQILGQTRAVLDGEGVTLDVADLNLTIVETAEAIDLSDIVDEGSAATYSVSASGENFSVNHYLFADLASSPDAAADTAMSDDDIDRMLNAEDVDARVSIDDEVGPDVNVQQVEFGSFADNSGSVNGQPRNIDMLLDVDLEVLVELGRKTMLIKEVLKLGKGSIVELDKAAGEPLGIFVNGRKLAEGEVVVVDDHFGIRITQLAGAAERIKSLG